MKKLLIAALFLGLFFNENTAFAQTETSGRTGVYRATHTKSTELKHTKLRVNFNFEKEQMNGEAWITASPFFYASNELVLDAKGMIINEVALEKNGARTPLKYDYKEDILKISLDKTYQKNQDYTVYIKYVARPNEVKQKGSAAINDAKGLYFINAQGKDADKPTQIWTQGETESSSCWFPTIDKPNQKTTQEIYMTVPKQYVTLSNGILKSSENLGENLRTDHWVMDKKHAPYLFFMGVGEYAVIKDKWRNIDVDYYVEKEYEPYAKQIFGNTPEMIEFFSKKLNYDFPWQKYAQIVGRDYVSGAMENTTAVIHEESAQQKAGDLADENKWEDVIAHELFHHWFGDLVTAESWSNLTVNESFADYSEYLWNEYKYGKDEADYKRLKSLRNSKADPRNFGKDLVRFNYESREDMFDGVSYNKGGGILHMLRNYLGDDAFFAGLSDYLKTNEYGTGEAHQLRLSLEKVSGKDLNWFFNQWYFGKGYPKLEVKSTFDPMKKQVTVNVAQTQEEKFEFPLSIDVLENGKISRKEVWVTAKAKNDFVFDVTKNPELINANPEGLLLSDIKQDKTPEQLYLQYTTAKDLYSKYTAIEEAKDQVSKNPFADKLYAAALKDKFYRNRLLALEGLPEDPKSFLADVEKLAQNDEKNLVKGAAIGVLAKTKNPKYLPLFEKGINAVSNSVKGNSLSGIAQVAPEKVVNYAEKIDLESASEDLVMTLLPVIVKNKITAQMPNIASLVAFYPFIGFQNPKLAAPAEEGFNWIMDSDNTKAVHNLTKVLGQAKSQIGDNVQAKMMIVQMLKKGLERKMKLFRENPSSTSLNTQIEMLNKAITSYSN